MTANPKSLATAVSLVTCLLAHSALASDVGPLTTFVPGTTAKASQVNGNFAQVKAAVDDNYTRITKLQSNPQIGGNITLAEPSTATAGNIMKGTSSFLHNFGTRNTFVGLGAGNFTMMSTDNTAVGFNALTHNAGDRTAYGTWNTAIGSGALTSNTTGYANTATGWNALATNTTGIANTASGLNALTSNTTGGYNTASGANALQNNTTGSENTASGRGALFANTTGNSNTASGGNALRNNTTGTENTASGSDALSNNTTGNSNSASGSGALFKNTTGSENTASGDSALSNNTTGSYNTASGDFALYHNTTGTENTASGNGALSNNTTGRSNAAFGYNALAQVHGTGPNTAFGYSAGYGLTSGVNNIYIANTGVATESATTRIGDSNQTRTFISGIHGAAISAGTAVLISASGQLGTMSSSRRVKDHIADMGESSSGLMKLRPVTFYYKTDHDPKGRTMQYGLVAEEVAEVIPGLVGRSSDGRIETVYYQFLAPMLLNEVQKQRHQIEAQAALVAKQRGRIAELERDRREQMTRIEALEQRTERLAGLLDQLEVTGKVAAR